MRQDGKEVSAGLLPLWPLAGPGEFSKRPLMFLWQTLGMKGWLWACSCAQATSWKGRASWGRNTVAKPQPVTGFFSWCLLPVNLPSTSTTKAVSLKALS